MIKHNKCTIIFLTIFAFAVTIGLFSSAVFAQEHEGKCADCKSCLTLVIVHDNDFHGNLKPLKDKRISKTDLVGGSAYIAAMIEDIREKYPGKVLVLDAGDIAQGTPISNIFEGKPVVEVMNRIGYDAMTIGNHEFDWGQEALKQMISKAEFPVVCANVVYEDDPNRIFLDLKPYIIKEVGNIKVGIIGVTTPTTPTITKAENVKGLKFLNPAKTVRRYIPEMKKDGASVIIVLSHMGFSEDIKLAEKVRGIDVIVGGHSHTKLKKTKKVRNTLIVQAGSKGRYLGKLVMKLDPDTKQVKHYTADNEIIPVLHEGLEPDEEIMKIVSRYENKIEDRMSRVIGKAEIDLMRSPGKGRADSDLGNLICDSLRAETGADVAIYNPGGIRADIYAGDVTVEDMFNVLPFDNALVTFEIPGSSLLKVLEHGASGSGSAQVSGVTFAIDYSKPGGQRVSDVMVNGEPLDKDAYYTVTTVDFLFMGGDDYNFEGAKNVCYGSDARSVFSHYVKEKGTISPPDEARIKTIKGKKEK